MKKKTKSKNVQDKSKPTVNRITPLVAVGTGIGLTLFLLGNIIGAQSISPLYFGLIKEDRTAVVHYLRKISRLNFFPAQLKQYQSIYGQGLENLIFAEKYQRDEMINKLEQELKKNLKSRDILYQLSQLYLANGNNEQAQRYWQRTKQLDPTIK